MFINKLVIKNFKGFAKESTELKFNIPDGSEGSGLNVFIGENNSGKSTILEAIDFIRNGTKKDLDSICHKNILNEIADVAKVELEFKGSIKKVINNFAQPNKQSVFINGIYECDEGHSYFKIARSTDDIKKLKIWDKEKNIFENKGGLDAPLKALFEINFIWANTNPNDEATFGASTLCGTLLKEIATAHEATEEFIQFKNSFNEIFNCKQSNLSKEIAKIENRLNTIFSDHFDETSLKFKFDLPKVDTFFKTASLLVDDGIQIKMDEKGSGMQRCIALALLQVYAEELALDRQKNLSKPFYLFIDEPEISLHPQGQKKLFDSLLKISADKQVFITTHSPYFLHSRALNQVGLFIFQKKASKMTIESFGNEGYFPWSPTWGEINYKAYNMPTTELHNELYGFIQQNIKEDGKLEDWLQQQGCQKDQQWKRELNNSFREEDVTLMTLIRNHIHHPENKYMKSVGYTQEQLTSSINKMIELLPISKKH